MTITQQIRDALAASTEPLDIRELAERCTEAVTNLQVASACHAMVERGEATREKPPEGGRFRYRLAGAPPAPADDDLGVLPIPKDATEARASRVTPSEKPNGSGSGPRAHARGRRRSMALPVLGKAPPARPALRAPVSVEPDLQIALTEAGVLALRRGEVVMYLSPEERARVEAFTARFRS